MTFRPILCRGVVGVGVLLWALSSPCTVGTAADAYRVTGIVSFPNPLDGGTVEMPFGVLIDGSRYRIDVDPDVHGSPGYLTPVQCGWDGRLSWFLQDLRPAIKAKSRSLGRVGSGADGSAAQNTGIGIVRRSPVPATILHDELGAIWIALCSASYFRESSAVPLAEPPTCHGVLGPRVRDPRSYHRLPVEVAPSEGTEPFQVPSKVVYYRELYPESHRDPIQLDRIRESAPVAAVFEALTWTNLSGVTLPGSARYRAARYTHAAPAASQGEPDVVPAPLAALFEVRISQVRPVAEPFAVQPELPGMVAVSDTRFPETERNVVTWQSDRWLTDDEVRELSSFGHAVRVAKAEQELIRRRGRAPYFVVGFAVLFVVPPLVLGVRWWRQRSA